MIKSVVKWKKIGEAEKEKKDEPAMTGAKEYRNPGCTKRIQGQVTTTETVLGNISNF